MTAEDLTDISINCSGSQESDSMWKNAYDPSFTATEKRCHGLTGLPPNISCDLSTNIPSGVQRMCKCMNSSKLIFSSQHYMI